jgi:serine/threonine protein phosphatase PrpC
MLPDEDIHHLVLEGGSLEEICSRLVDNANERGGADNITVVLVLIEKQEKGLFRKLFGAGQQSR